LKLLFQTATASVKITIVDVNDNNPEIVLDAVQFEGQREKGYIITTVSVCSPCEAV